jgi:hypothetical protein
MTENGEKNPHRQQDSADKDEEMGSTFVDPIAKMLEAV